jgi:hypothetical protein
MPSRIEVPGMTSSPLTPCHCRVQPPAWLPMLFALRPGDVDARVAAQRQHVALVLQQYLRLGGGLARHRPVCRASDLIDVGGGGVRVLEESQVELHAQDAPYRVVDVGHADPSGGDLGGEQLLGSDSGPASPVPTTTARMSQGPAGVSRPEADVRRLRLRTRADANGVRGKLFAPFLAGGLGHRRELARGDERPHRRTLSQR